MERKGIMATTEVILSDLKELTRKAITNRSNIYQDKKSLGGSFYIHSEFITVNTKTLKDILLATGGMFTVIVDASVHTCFIAKQPLGVGVYNIRGKTVAK